MKPKFCWSFCSGIPGYWPVRVPFSYRCGRCSGRTPWSRCIFVADNAFKDRMGRIVPRGNYDAFDFQMRRSEPEVDLVVAPDVDRTYLRFITDHFRPDVARRVAAFERVEPFVVGGDAGGRTREQDDGVGIGSPVCASVTVPRTRVFWAAQGRTEIVPQERGVCRRVVSSKPFRNVVSDFPKI